MLMVSTKEMDELAKKIWDVNKLGDKIDFVPEMWNNNEFDPAIGSIDFEDWHFSTNENSDYVFYTHNGYEGEFLMK